MSFFHLVSGSLRGWWNIMIYQTSGTLGQEIATFQRIPLHPSWLILLSNWSVSRDKVMQIGVWRHMFFVYSAVVQCQIQNAFEQTFTKETIGCSFIPCDSMSVSSWFSFVHCFACSSDFSMDEIWTRTFQDFHMDPSHHSLFCSGLEGGELFPEKAELGRLKLCVKWIAG